MLVLLLEQILDVDVESTGQCAIEPRRASPRDLIIQHVKGFGVELAGVPVDQRGFLLARPPRGFLAQTLTQQPFDGLRAALALPRRALDADQEVF